MNVTLGDEFLTQYLLKVVQTYKFPGELALFTFSDLIQYQRKGFRNGNWRRLSSLERAFFRASICYAKVRGRIINSAVVANLTSIVEKMSLTFSKRVLITGSEKSRVLFLVFKEKGIFTWVPELEGWLRDPKYLLWLGLQRNMCFNS